LSSATRNESVVGIRAAVKFRNLKLHDAVGNFSRSLTVAGLRLWNNLPLHLRDSEHTSLEFRRLLKTHLFCWGHRHLVTVCLLSVL